jgi:uncharacterized membrane protein YjjP (DUF1212 family)
VSSDPESFILALGHALHVAGAPAHRLEDAIAQLSPRLGIEARVFSSPTVVMISFGPPEAMRTTLLRVEPAGIDLAGMVRLDELIDALSAGRIDVAEARAGLEALAHAPERYPAWLTVLAYGLASATVARFLDGGGREIAAAALIGLQTGVLAHQASRHPGAARLLEWIASLLAGAASVLWAAAFGPLAATLAALAGLIVIVPGLNLTVALTELATRNLVSGTARLAGAATTFLAIGFGLALGAKIAPLAAGRVLALPAGGLPGWTGMLALVLSPSRSRSAFAADRATSSSSLPQDAWRSDSRVRARTGAAPNSACSWPRSRPGSSATPGRGRPGARPRCRSSPRCCSWCRERSACAA